MTEPNAEWLLNPISERELTQQRQAERNLRVAKIVFALVGYVLGFATLIGLLHFLYRRSSLGVLLLIGSATVFLFALLAYLRIREIARQKLVGARSVLDDYHILNGWPVRLTVYQGHTPTGTDEGLIWFEEGKMYFVGGRTSFGLAPHQLVGEMRDAWLRIGGAPSKHLRLTARSKAGEISLGLDPISLQGDGMHPPNTIAELPGALSTWLKSPQDAGGQLPPLAIGPEAPSPTALLADAVSSSLVWAAFFAAAVGFGLLLGAWYIPLFLFLVAGVLALFWDICLPRRAWLAYRDRMRLERGNE